MDLVAEIPFGQLDGPTFVDDDTVLLCADSPSQLIDKICEATRIYVDTARKFGLTLNFDKGKTEALVSWGRKGRSQVLLRDYMPEKLGTLPHPAVEPEAWERPWKAYPRSWKQLLRAFVNKMATGTDQCCYSARLGMCAAVSEHQDLEFLCPSCPAGARTWPTRAALRSHMMWRNPWRQFVAGSCCPVCQKQFHTRARAVDHLAHRAERCRQATQQDPDLFPKLETDMVTSGCRKVATRRV